MRAPRPAIVDFPRSFSKERIPRRPIITPVFESSMPQKVRIALDAMGGDHGPSVVVPGAGAGAASRQQLHPGRRPGPDRAAARRPSAAQGGLAARAHRRRGPDGRQAEPGAAQRPLEVVDVARHRRGQERRGRRRGVRRQHRRADGDGQVQSENAAGDRAPGDRRALADAEGHLHRARSLAPRSGRTRSN